MANSQIVIGRDFSEHVLELVLSLTPARVTIQCGNYMLRNDGERPVDGLGRGYIPLHDPYHQLAVFTWHLGCDIASALRRRGLETTSIIVLVNDWQHLDFPAQDRRSAERMMESVRRRYYREVNTWPDYYRQSAEARGIWPTVAERYSDAQWLFSENHLRRESVALLRDSIATSEGLLRERRNSLNEPEIIYADPFDFDGRSFCLTQSGQSNCAGEILKLCFRSSRESGDVFLNLYPLQCMSSILMGSAVAKNVLKTAGTNVHIGVPLSAQIEGSIAIVDIG